MSVATNIQETEMTLRGLYYKYQEINSGKRMIDIARDLGVSEGRLVASLCGDQAVRLTTDVPGFLKSLPALKEVMVLTRNKAMVHEKIGQFDHIGIMKTMAQVVNGDVDLRIFLRHWMHIFALRQEKKNGALESFQIFDEQGKAVHKIFLRPESDKATYQEIIETFRSDDQSPIMEIDEAQLPSTPPTSKVDSADFREDWLGMKDTHDFYPMIYKLGITRYQAYQIIDDDLARQISIKVFEAALRKAAETEVPIMVFVGNDGCIQIHTGQVHNIKEMGKWLNVMDDTFTLHAYQPLIAEAWLVRKPTSDGTVTSLELFDEQGEELCLMFGERKPGRPERQEWRTLIEGLADAI